MKTKKIVAIIEASKDGFGVYSDALPGITGFGNTIEEAKANLKEAIELFLEHASKSEISSRLRNEVFITNLQIAVG